MSERKEKWCRMLVSGKFACFGFDFIRAEVVPNECLNPESLRSE